MSLTGNIAVVTGGAAGIGYAIVEALLEQGASVMIFDLNGIVAAEAAASLSKQYKGRVASCPGNVTSTSDLDAAFDSAEGLFGPVDVLINNAGFSTIAPLMHLTEEDWTRVLSVLTTGPFLGTKILANRAVKHGIPANVVNTSSLNYKAATNGLAHYCTAKAGVSQFTKVAASELGQYGIRVNAVAPGLVRTNLTESAGLTTGLSGQRFLERTPLGRVGVPRDVAKVVAFLVSSDAGWITGQTISVDGGNEIRGLHSYWDTALEQAALDGV
ncbi:SDR family NAD(P)-dependent oxidoreductase [Rhodococcus koreensis]|uniref:SDR family NAD(P)-dependent oxidoreductase n=1 Tax=Rhodococcus koreensis TaxID=99653 RepID=UPI0036705CFC